jgi:hypothetical protein
MTGEQENHIKRISEHIEDAANSVAPQLIASHALGRRIVNIFKQEFIAYYKRHPDRAGDERSRDNEEWITRALHDSLQLLAEYAISYKQERDK